MSTSAEKQPTWFLSAATGSNRNSGIDSAHPLRDCEERQRRVGRAPVRQPTTITYMDSPSASDCEVFDRVPIGVGGSLMIQGTLTVVTSGTLTGFTGFNRATQSKNIISDTGLAGGFAAHVGRFCRITGGARVGTVWSITKDLGGGSAEIASPGITTATSFGSFARSTPQTGDPYDIVTAPILRAGAMDFIAGSQQRPTTGFNRVIVQDLEIDFGNKTSGVSTDFASGISSDYVAAQLTRCKLDAVSVRGSSLRVFQCYHSGYILVAVGASVFMNAGAHTSHIQINTGAYARLDFDELFQGGQITLSRGGYVEIGTACVFDKVGDGIALNAGGVALCSPLSDAATSALWGNGNTGRGVNLNSGARLHWYSGAGGAKPTINAGLGLGREVMLGDADFLYADIPAEARGAAMGLWP